MKCCRSHSPPPCIRGMLSQVVAQPFSRDEGVGDYLLLDKVGAWIPSSLCPCGSVCVCVCVCGARDTRIKKRLVEIKALPQSLPVQLQATRMTNPSLITLQYPPWSQVTEALAAALSTGWGGSIELPPLCLLIFHH